ncbi:MAG: anti-sigma factor family protein [Planctomycetota bacterium]|jgi:anti-sigma factor ChrR (cupin superfamily)
MSCPDRELLSAFADGELEEPKAAAIERHLAGCPACGEFVGEMRRLDSYGRSSLRAIPVKPSRAAVLLPASARGRRLLRPLTLAAAAALVIALSIAAWFLASNAIKARKQESVEEGSMQIVTPTTTRAMDLAELEKMLQLMKGPRDEVRSDDAFERWAAPYRLLRIPLVPMEEVANHKPDEIPPTLPVRTGLNGKS